ncbi:GNAT family N-acetyltransferase [Streptomyces sp. NPDC051561]|uniref:GNAT family N-acetyltransferase n=1 Tax=Streptomyces sp. NPDC051561 TaxID=3365658 RepID=UPI0037AD9F2C
MECVMLAKLETSDYARAKQLFPASYPNLAFVHAVLDEGIPGQVWTQTDREEPEACLIATQAPFCFAAGALSKTFFTEAAALLAGHGGVQLVLPPGAGTEELARQAGFTAGQRRQFSRPDQGWRRPAVTVPDAYELVRIDAETFAGLESPMARGIFGTPDQYARHSVGFGLRSQGRIVADAHGVVGGGLIEAGVFVDPGHRGRGLAHQVLAAVCDWGADNGLKPMTSCHADKQASIALSHGLGLVEDFRYATAELV